MVTMAISAARLSPGRYRVVTTCQEILSRNLNRDPSSSSAVVGRYPTCANLTATDDPVYTIVTGSLNAQYPEEVGALLGLVFGAAAWMAQVLSILAVEVYLDCTRDEQERLRKVSLVRAKAAHGVLA